MILKNHASKYSTWIPRDRTKYFDQEKDIKRKGEKKKA